jgi:hypothetical protein
MEDEHMNRKTYEKKMRALILAISKYPGSKTNRKIGELMRYDAKKTDTITVYGSCKAAWESEAFRAARQLFNVR